MGVRPSVGPPGRYCVLSDSTPLRTLASTSPTSSAGSATTPTNLWQPISPKGSDSTPRSSWVRMGTSPHLAPPLDTPPWARNFGAPARFGGTSSTPASPFPAHVPQRPGGGGAHVGAGQAPSAPPLDWVVRVLPQPPLFGSCTSTVRGRRRTSWSRTGSGAPQRATDRAPPPSTPPASRPSPHLPREPTYASRTTPRTTSTSLSWRPRSYTRLGVADAEARATAGVRELSWLHLRLDIQQRRGEPYVAIHRWTRLRLFRAFACTNNPSSSPSASSVSSKRAFRVWRRLTNAIRLVMAISETRTLGSGGQVARHQSDLEPRARRCAAQQGPPGQRRDRRRSERRCTPPRFPLALWDARIFGRPYSSSRAASASSGPCSVSPALPDDPGA